MTHVDQPIALAKVASMLAGNREIVSPRQLEAPALWNRDDVATCRNRNRVGVLDEFVAWIGNANKPKDLEFHPNGYAIGSK